MSASAPVHKSGRWEAREKVAAILFYRKKKNKREKRKAKTSCMSEIVKSCGNQLLSKYGLNVAVTQAAAKVNPSNIYVGAYLFAKVPRHS